MKRAPIPRAPLGTLGSLVLLLVALSGCSETVDSLGYDRKTELVGLRPLDGPETYPNPFRDLLGKTQSEIDSKINDAFDQLFHGSPDTEAIFFPVDDDHALVRDLFHNDVRTEGMGLAMLIAVELDHRDEFDDLWRYAKSELGATGASVGYYESSCDSVDGLTAMPCIDPFGMEQFAMALVFAHGRWKSTGAVDYQADALELFDVMRHKEDRNGGIVDGVTNLFDTETRLVFHEPNVAASSVTRPSIVIPAYYELWGQATGDPFWDGAAAAGRTYHVVASHPTTGLVPVRSDLSGALVSGWDSFRHEAYRFEINLALDGIWFPGNTDDVARSDRLLGFFWGQGIDTYGNAFELDGTVLDPGRDPSLVSTNGAAGAIATRTERESFVQAVWDQGVLTGPVRYYAGLMQMLSLMVLGGQFRVY